MKGASAKTVAEKRRHFLFSLWGSLALCVIIHLVAPLFANDGFLRMTLTLLFFGCLASAAWSFSSPYSEYLCEQLRWRYADAGTAVKHNVERYLYRWTTCTGRLANQATLGIGSIGFAILSQWNAFAALQPLYGFLVFAGVISLVGIPASAWAMSSKIREAIAFKREFIEAMRLSGAHERDIAHEQKERDQDLAAPVQIIGPQAFRAGGFDWRWSDFYKNAAVFGQTGTGKTICVLNALLDGLVGSSGNGGLPAAGLILDPKGDFRGKIRGLCKHYGREKDLVMIDPSAPAQSMHWNPLDSSDDAFEIAERLGAVMQILNPSGNNDAFWIESCKRLAQNLINLQRFAEPNRAPDLVTIYEMAMDDELIEQWANRVDTELYDTNPAVSQTFNYILKVWQPMPGDTKGTVRSFISNMLTSFLSQPYDLLFSGNSTHTMGQLIDEGKILYVHMPIADKETMSRVVSTLVKLEYYREVLKRPRKKRPSFFLCDEFQAFFTTGLGKGDNDAFARTRESNHANIIAFQNINALFSQTDTREPVLNLLGNCAIKLFLRNTEKETNEFASELFGQQIESISGTSVSIAGGANASVGPTAVSGSGQYADRVRREEFVALAVPSVEDGSKYAETIGHLAVRAQVQTERLRWKVHPLNSD